MVPANFFHGHLKVKVKCQMSNTNKYCLGFLLTTYDITIVNETTQFTHIIVHLDILQGNNEV